MLGVILGIAIGGSVLCGAVVLRGKQLRVRTEILNYSALPEVFDGFRICLLSDLHERRYGKENKKLFRKIKQQHPDLILFAGDLTPRNGKMQNLLALLSALTGTGTPVFLVGGNHDPRFYGKYTPEEVLAWQEAIRNTNAVLLEHHTVPVCRDGSVLWLTGVGYDNWKEAQTLLPENGFRLLLCHNPMLFDHLSALPELTLAGHVHGGLIRLPGIGAIFSPGDGIPIHKRFHRRYFFPKYHCGIYRNGTSRLAVTVGLGCSVLPVRIIRPEIMVLELKKSK